MSRVPISRFPHPWKTPSFRSKTCGTRPLEVPRVNDLYTLRGGRGSSFPIFPSSPFHPRLVAAKGGFVAGNLGIKPWEEERKRMELGREKRRIEEVLPTYNEIFTSFRRELFIGNSPPKGPRTLPSRQTDRLIHTHVRKSWKKPFESTRANPQTVYFYLSLILINDKIIVNVILSL